VRAHCPRCLRPGAFCVCTGLVPVPTRTRVVLLQHPREARLAICSAWLTRIALADAELHRGVSFEAHPRVRELAGVPGACLLWPGPGSVPARTRRGSPPAVLFAVDGTWHQAEKMMRLSPSLGALPRLSVDAGRPSGYTGLRAEPGAVHLSTLEAVALALGDLEGEPGRFEPMVAAFHRSVALQIACARGSGRNPRHHRRASRTPLPGAEDEDDRPRHAGQSEGQVEDSSSPGLPSGERTRVGADHAAQEPVADPHPGGERPGHQEDEDREPVERARPVEEGLHGVEGYPPSAQLRAVPGCGTRP
jgi:tRNA-uridine aminocarboxypropyltransferase